MLDDGNAERHRHQNDPNDLGPVKNECCHGPHFASRA